MVGGDDGLAVEFGNGLRPVVKIADARSIDRLLDPPAQGVVLEARTVAGTCEARKSAAGIPDVGGLVRRAPAASLPRLSSPP